MPEESTVRLWCVIGLLPTFVGSRQHEVTKSDPSAYNICRGSRKPLYEYLGFANLLLFSVNFQNFDCGDLVPPKKNLIQSMVQSIERLRQYPVITGFSTSMYTTRLRGGGQVFPNPQFTFTGSRGQITSGWTKFDCIYHVVMMKNNWHRHIMNVPDTDTVIE